MAEGLVDEFKRVLPGQRKTQRHNLALLTATTLDVRSANLMALAAALPRDANRTDMRYQWIARVLGNKLIEPNAVMEPFGREVLARAGVDGQSVVLILDQSKLSDRFYGAADLVSLCQGLGWDYRLRLKGNLVVRDGGKVARTGALADDRAFALEGVQLTAKKTTTSIGVLRDPGHKKAWIVEPRGSQDIAVPGKPGYLATLDYSKRWGIEPMFSDFKSRGFGIEDTQIQHPGRLARLLLVMASVL